MKVGALTKSDPDYLRLNQKGSGRVMCRADQIVQLMNWIIDRDRTIIELEKSIEIYRDALVEADLQIRSMPGKDQSDVEEIRAALAAARGNL